MSGTAQNGQLDLKSVLIAGLSFLFIGSSSMLIHRTADKIDETARLVTDLAISVARIGEDVKDNTNEVERIWERVIGP